MRSAQREIQMLIRVAPLEVLTRTCEVMLAQRMLPKWLQAFKAAAPRKGEGAVASCEVLHSPEYWLLSKSYNLALFVVKYR